ncbi:VaFE repeat-containing surface-anchored protein [Corynebacterium hindlerae]|uniref:VaFE repeat-containing surface-anchored protein n=1 Tax=Corynebacterium hindlerae TaxID=699041 RepID=UPI001AD6174C|nr:VaFE repeat-containing surface-anchored protein [Corynebacterium hindlerae]QTH59533.1 VaFE repeat-containing surface-anchored protein [Corynebacterium hindlerae]
MTFRFPFAAAPRGVAVIATVVTAVVTLLAAFLYAPNVSAQEAAYTGHSEGVSSNFYVRDIHSQEKEIAYCMNKEYLPPSEVSTLTAYYTKVATAGNFNSFTQRNVADDLDATLLKVMWNGAPNDAQGLVKKGALTENQLREVTQAALWYYTDNFDANGYLVADSVEAKLFRQMTGRGREGDADFALVPPPAVAVLYVYEPTAQSNQEAREKHGNQWQNLLSSTFVHKATGKTITPDTTVDSKDDIELRFEKHDAKTNKPLSGATLRLKPHEIAVQYLDEVWETNGEPHSVKVRPGTYELFETKAPAGYEPMDPSQRLAYVKVSEQGSISLSEVFDGRVSLARVGDVTSIVVGNNPVQMVPQAPKPPTNSQKPTLNTNAFDGSGLDATDNRLPAAGGVVKDTLSYTGLMPQTTYLVHGELMDKETGKPVGIEKTETLTTADQQGEHTMTFEVPAGHAGKSLVVFETIYENTADGKIADKGKFVVRHADLNSASQTVLIDTAVVSATLATQAVNKATGRNILSATGGTIVDTVNFTGLNPNENYVLKGELMDKNTTQSTGIVAEHSFTPQAADGATKVEFHVDTQWAGKDLVVFEELFDSTGKKVAEHRDYGAASQTVIVEGEKEGFGWVVPAIIGGGLIAGGLLSGPSSSDARVSEVQSVANPVTPKDQVMGISNRPMLANTGVNVLGVVGIAVALLIGGIAVLLRLRRN